MLFIDVLGYRALCSQTWFLKAWMGLLTHAHSLVSRIVDQHLRGDAASFYRYRGPYCPSSCTPPAGEVLDSDVTDPSPIYTEGERGVESR